MKYSYYKLDGLPCRIEECEGLGAAEIYQPGTGFVDGPRMEIEFAGVPISSKKFEQMIIALSLKSNA